MMMRVVRQAKRSSDISSGRGRLEGEGVSLDVVLLAALLPPRREAREGLVSLGLRSEEEAREDWGRQRETASREARQGWTWRG